MPVHHTGKLVRFIVYVISWLKKKGSTKCTKGTLLLVAQESTSLSMYLSLSLTNVHKQNGTIKK